MAKEIDRILHHAEDFLRRNVRSRSARDAHKRRAQRKLKEFFRRLRRSGYILAAMLVALIAYSLFIAPVGLLTWIVAVPTIALIAFLSLFWSAGRAPDPVEAPATIKLDTLSTRVEDGLIERSREFPGRALPAADAIIARLAELHPHLGQLERGTVLEGEARRLVGQHLPRLVDAYLSLPQSAREPESEASRRFCDNLDTVREELDHLLDRCCRDRHLTFETQSRFIESRYSEDPSLRRD